MISVTSLIKFYLIVCSKNIHLAQNHEGALTISTGRTLLSGSIDLYFKKDLGFGKNNSHLKSSSLQSSRSFVIVIGSSTISFRIYHLYYVLLEQNKTCPYKQIILCYVTNISIQTSLIQFFLSVNYNKPKNCRSLKHNCIALLKKMQQDLAR